MIISFTCPEGHALKICDVRQISVAFRSAKVAFFRSFAERKTTIKDCTMLIASLVAGPLLLLGTITGVILWATSSNIKLAKNSLDLPAESQSPIAPIPEELLKGSREKNQTTPNGEMALDALDSSVGCGFQLLEGADYFAMDSVNGSLAAVTSSSRSLYLYPSEYLAGKSKKVIGPVSVGLQPGHIRFKQHGERGLYIVHDRIEPMIRCFDAKSLELVQSISTPCFHVVNMDVVRNANSSRIFFQGSNLPLQDGNSQDSIVYAVDLDDPSSVTEIAKERSSSDIFQISPDGTTLIHDRTFARLSNERLSQPLSSQPLMFRSMSINNFGAQPIFDPSGATVAIKKSVYATDFSAKLFDCDALPLCYLIGKPFLVGIAVDTASMKDFELKVRLVELATGKTSYEWPIPMQELPGGLKREEFRHPEFFVNAFAMFHSLHDNALQIALKDWTHRLSLESIKSLETNVSVASGSVIPIIGGPGRIVADESVDAPISIASDADAKFELVAAPDGITLENNRLKWTPTMMQVKAHSIKVKWQSNERTGDVNWLLDVVFPDSRPDVTEFPVNFPVHMFNISWDTSSAVLVGEEYPGSLQSRDSSSRLAVVNLIENRVENSISLPYPVHAARIDKAFVYAKPQTEKLEVRRRDNLQLRSEFFVNSVSAFAAFADRILVANNVYTVPELKPIRRMQKENRQAVPPITKEFIQHVYARTESEWLVDGIRFDSSMKVMRVEAPNFLGIQRYSPLASHTATQAMGEEYTDHPTYFAFVKLTGTTELGMLEIVDRSAQPKGNTVRSIPIKFGPPHRKYSDDDGMKTSQIIGKYLYVILNGVLQRIDLGDLGELGIPLKPFFEPQESAFLLPLGKPVTLYYTIRGGVAPFTMGRSTPPPNLLTPEISDNQVKVRLALEDPKMEQALIETLSTWVRHAISQTSGVHDMVCGTD